LESGKVDGNNVVLLYLKPL